MKSLSEIEIGVQVKGRDENLSLTTSTNLTQVNSMYRGLAGALPWSEFTVEDLSIETSASDGREKWPVDVSFLDVLTVEMKDKDRGNEYRTVWPAPDVRKMSRSRRKAKQSLPDFYFRLQVGVIHYVEFAPIPKYLEQAVRITGIREPKDFTSANQKTPFLLLAADDALEHIIAAHYQQIDGFPQDAALNLNNATRILQQIFGKEIVPDDLTQQIAGA